MSLRGGIDGELRRLGNTLRGTDRGSAEFHDNEHSSRYWATLRVNMRSGRAINYSRLMEACLRRSPVIDAVEQKLERPMRLCTERDLRPEEHDVTAAQRDIDRGSHVLELLLAQRPAAPERHFAVEPDERPHLAPPRMG